MRDFLVVVLSLLIAFCLTMLIPQAGELSFSPPWIFLLLCYWAVSRSAGLRLTLVFCAGLLLDVFTGVTFGVHGLAMIIPLAFLLFFYRSLSRLNRVQHLVLIFFLVFIYQAILVCIHGFMGASTVSALYWLSPLSSVIVWALIVMPFKRSRH